MKLFSEIASSSSSLASDRLAKENKGRVKSLFDESDSGEDDDIFEQISNVVNKRPGADRSTSKPDDDDEKALPSTKKVLTIDVKNVYTSTLVVYYFKMSSNH